MLDRSKKSTSSVRLPSSFFHRLVSHLTLCELRTKILSKYARRLTGLKTTEIQLDIIAIKKVDLRRTKGGTILSLKFFCSDVKEKIFQIQKHCSKLEITCLPND